MILIVDKYKRIEPKKQSFLGERSERHGVIAGDMRCIICGDWFSWSKQNINKYVMERRWDERRNEPAHCGSEHCDYYHRRYLRHLERMATDKNYWAEMSFKIWSRREKQQEHDALNLFGNLKQKGLVA